jgi:hypothetical protein
MGHPAALRPGKAWTLDSLVKALDGPAYWETFKRKDKNGKPSENSWRIRKARYSRLQFCITLNTLTLK